VSGESTRKPRLNVADCRVAYAMSFACGHGVKSQPVVKRYVVHIESMLYICVRRKGSRYSLWWPRKLRRVVSHLTILPPYENETVKPSIIAVITSLCGIVVLRFLCTIFIN
jgi:hypothetical protein